MGFGIVPPEAWLFGPCVSAEQLARLHKPVGYEEIIHRLVPNLCVAQCKLMPRKAPSGFTRVELLLVGPAEDIELWYSGSGGYRAQYLLGEGVGDAANAFAVDYLLEHFAGDLTAWLAPIRPRLLETLTPTTAKVWIKEGRWYHHAKMADIAQAVRQAPTPSEIDPKRANKLRLKGSAAPSGEPRIVLKGPWIGDADQSEHPELAKAHRALEISRFRFT